MPSNSILFVLLFSLRLVLALWPAPQSLSLGQGFLYINQNIEVTYNGAFLPYTYGYNPSSLSSQQVVQAGLSRALGAIFSSKFVPWMLHPRNQLSAFEPDVYKGQTWLKTLKITQTGTDQPSTFKPLAGEVDESYNLTVTADGSAHLSAASSIGVLWGLQTFTQLFFQHSTGTFWYTPYAPVSIQDAPKYPHRGVLMDVSRNFYPVQDIMRTIDGLSWNKMNRLHLHATDAQSWPLVIPALPEVAEKGAYGSNQVYSAADLQNLQEYGAARGVEVIVEIDMPGHISSLWWSHPELITAYNGGDGEHYYWYCNEPPCGALRMNESAVYDFLETLFNDLLPRVAPYSAYFHTGGDELNANDSMLDPSLRTNDSSVIQPLLQKFIDTQHAHVRKGGLVPMVWEEIPLTWNVTLGNDTVIQTWLGDSSVSTLTGMGHKVIDSNYNFWYLDCGRGQWLNFDNGAAFQSFYPFTDWCTPTKNWRLIYSHDPAEGLNGTQAKLVLGGEVALWSETIDPMNLDSLLWPRTSAAGEVLWSGRQDASGQNRSQLDAAPRLSEMRERMVALGVGASPVQMTFCTQAGNATECSYAP